MRPIKEGRMTEPIWNKFLTERDKVFHESRGFGARQGFGKRPALLIIDVNYAFCGDKREAIMESVKRWPTPGTRCRCWRASSRRRARKACR
jgi:maleamate amidohydrolase